MADFDLSGLGGGDLGDLGGLGQDIMSYVPSSMAFSPGTALSVGPAGGGGGGSWLDALSGYAQSAKPFLQLGTGALSAYTGIQGMLESQRQQQALRSAERTAGGAAAPALAGAQQLIPAGTTGLMTGQLPPGLEAQVNNWKNNWRAQLHNYYARAGISDSSMMAEADAVIESQAQELRAQLAQSLLTGGQGLAGTAISGAGTGGQLALGGSGQVNNAIAAANNAMMRLLGAS